MTASGEGPLPAVEGYEVIRRLGKGGMGEVLEAERVGPEGFRKRVALKQLALDLSIDRTAVSRFFLEARICARLEHPNIVRVQDLLNDHGRPFIVMELLRGLTLWELVRSLRSNGGVPWWVPLAIGEQALSALVYAHALAGDDGAPLGLVHRDLTPRNLMVTEEGVVKVLDFGIAKLTSSLSAPALTADGSVAGTLEFFSPEQAQAMPLDARSDLFQLAGAMFWALTGSPPNGGGTPAEVLTRAVMGKPLHVKLLRDDLPDEVAAFLDRALARDREERFPNAATMHAEVKKLVAGHAAPELAALVKPLISKSSVPSAAMRTQLASPLAVQRAQEVSKTHVPRESGEIPSPAPAGGKSIGSSSSRRTVLAGFAATIAVGAGAFYAGRQSVGYTPRAPRRPPEFNRLTWRRGIIYAARFTSDDSYLCSAAFDAEPIRTWLGVPGNPEGRALEFGSAQLVAVSKQQEISLLNDVELIYGFVRRGTLAQVMLSGGAPRDVLSDVQWVDYQPETNALAVVRWKGELNTLEFPLDTVRHSTRAGWIGEARFSPNGKHLAFTFHHARYDDAGSVWVIDAKEGATPRALTGSFVSIGGLAWRDARTVWFTGSKEGLTRDLHAVDLEGSQRLVDRAPASLQLFDIGARGRALIARVSHEMAAAGKLAGDASERELSIFDTSYAGHISGDGTRVLIGEGAGDGVGSEGGIFLRKGTAAPVRLGGGIAREIAPDGSSVLVNSMSRKVLTLLPTGAGSPVTLRLPEGSLVNTAVYFPDGKRVLASVNEEGSPDTHFITLEIPGGAVTRLPIAGFLGALVLPLTADGARAVLMNAATELVEWVDVATGKSTPLEGARKGEIALRVTSDGKSVFVAQIETRPLRVVRLDAKTGERSDFLTLAPRDAAGIDNVPWAVLSADGSAYAYTYNRILSTLYLMSDAD